MMHNNKKDYIFIDTNIYFNEKKSNLSHKLEKISKKYNIIIPSVQLHELQSHIADNHNRTNNFEQALSKLYESYRDENSYPEEFKKIAKQLKEDANELYNKLINNRKKIVKEIFDFLGKQEIIPFSAENFVGAENRVNSERAPYKKKEGSKKHLYYDSLMWESLLHYKKLENSTLYIYSKDGDFLNDNKDDINELLKTEWKFIQKGELILYKCDNKEEDEEEKTNNTEYSENVLLEIDKSYINQMNSLINKAQSIIRFIKIQYRRGILEKIDYIEKFQELDYILYQIDSLYDIKYSIVLEVKDRIEYIKSEKKLLYRRIFLDHNYF
ncbi:PIN domain-containing protein [Brachyspira pilosicoli]|uniref:PIN domain-containing protein n=1 Tax=Brachyspira pilosicoli TaxID=52584 RepID=UPI0030043F78